MLLAIAKEISGCQNIVTESKLLKFDNNNNNTVLI